MLSFKPSTAFFSSPGFLAPRPPRLWGTPRLVPLLADPELWKNRLRSSDQPWPKLPDFPNLGSGAASGYLGAAVGLQLLALLGGLALLGLG